MVLMIAFGCRSDVEIDPEYVGVRVINRPNFESRLLIYKEGRYDYSYYSDDSYTYIHCKCHMYDGILYLDGGFPPLYKSKGITAKIIGDNLWIRDLCFERAY